MDNDLDNPIKEMEADSRNKNITILYTIFKVER